MLIFFLVVSVGFVLFGFFFTLNWIENPDTEIETVFISCSGGLNGFNWE